MTNFETKSIHYFSRMPAAQPYLLKPVNASQKSTDNKNGNNIAQKLFSPKENKSGEIYSNFFWFVYIKSFGSYWAPKFEEFDLNNDENLDIYEILDESNMSNFDVGTLLGLLLENSIEKDAMIFNILNQFPINRRGEILYEIFPDKFKIPLTAKYAKTYPKEFYDTFANTKDLKVQEFLCESAIVFPKQEEEPFISIYILNPVQVHNFKVYDTNNDAKLTADEIKRIPDDNSIAHLLQKYAQKRGSLKIICEILNKLLANRRCKMLWWINDGISKYIIETYAYYYPAELWEGYKNIGNFDPNIKKDIAEKILEIYQALSKNVQSSYQKQKDYFN